MHVNEDLERLDLRDALERIAFPENWSERVYHGEAIVPDDLIKWMQSIASYALSNAGTFHYERKAKL